MRRLLRWLTGRIPCITWRRALIWAAVLIGVLARAPAIYYGLRGLVIYP